MLYRLPNNPPGVHLHTVQCESEGSQTPLEEKLYLAMLMDANVRFQSGLNLK